MITYVRENLERDTQETIKSGCLDYVVGVGGGGRRLEVYCGKKISFSPYNIFFLNV